MLAAYHQEFMEAAFGRLHNSGAGAFGARPTVVDSIILDGGAASIAIPKTHPQSEPTPMKAYFSKFGQMTLHWDRGIVFHS